MPSANFLGYTLPIMAVVICLLRGVNVSGHNKIKMDELRALCERLKLRDVRTHLQSGNVVFRTGERDLKKLGCRIGDAIEGKFGFRPVIVLRTAEEWRGAMARNPFVGRRSIDPPKLLVNFLEAAPADGVREKLGARKTAPDELVVDGRELYMRLPNGVAEATVPWTTVERLLGVAATGRNWNSVTKLMAIAEELEAKE